jgi:hypothetical protein
MKTNIALVLLYIFLIVACKKEKSDPPADTPSADVTPPTIVLKGKTNDTIQLQGSYVDPGATATDDKDGDISAFLLVSGTVNIKLTGTYLLKYDARDAAGNKSPTVTRNVHVVNAADFLTGTYNVACTCTATAGQSSPTVTTTNYMASAIASTEANNGFQLSTLRTGPDTVIANASLSGGSEIGISAHVGVASGTLVSNNSFIIETLNTPVLGPTTVYDCRNIFTRQ